jgi:hypothetical protein
MRTDPVNWSHIAGRAGHYNVRRKHFRLPTNFANFGEEAFGEKLNRKSPL